MLLKSMFISFIFGFLLYYKYSNWMNVSHFASNEEVVFVTYGIATFLNEGDWKFDSFVELAGNYSTSHYFDWSESSTMHRPQTYHNPIVLSNKIRNINKEGPILLHKVEELALKGYGIEQFNLEDSGKIHNCLKKLISH
jgi:hypothetical protein